jgi:sugar O-acyltransferase (sialic acid O-acetyltransferase NeuD family)
MMPDSGYVTIGRNEMRERVAKRLKEAGKSFGAALIHPRAVFLRSTIACGSVVMAGAVVQPEVAIGKHAIINTNASVDHECTIGDYVHIGPGTTLCGDVTVQHGAFLGAGVVVVPGVRIGRWQFVRAGTVVKGDLPDAEVAAVDAAADRGGKESLRERGA